MAATPHGGSGGGGGSADDPDESIRLDEGAPAGGSSSTAAPGADRSSPDSLAEDCQFQRRRSAKLDGRARCSSAGEDRPSPRHRDHRQSGSPSERRAARTEQSPTAPGESLPATPSTKTVVKSEMASDSERTAAVETETEDQLTHLELETVYRDTLSGLLTSDPLLSDLSASLTAAELRSLTALEHGTAMAVLVNRGDRLTRLIVQRSATVQDLKAALRSAVELEVARRGGRRRAVSWRYVWRANWLAFRGRRLTDDTATLEELGIGNKAEVGFVKRIRPKRGQKDKKGGQV